MQAGQNRVGEKEVGHRLYGLRGDEESCEENAARREDDKEYHEEDEREEASEESWASLLNVNIICNKTGRLAVRSYGCCRRRYANLLPLSVELTQP